MLCAVACNEDEAPAPRTLPAAQPEIAPAAPSQPGEQEAERATLSIAGARGQAWARAVPRADGGYDLESPDGTDLGKIKVEAGKVKLKDASGATQAKVKSKDYGFKIYADEETTLFKAKRKGAGFKIKGSEGNEVGELAVDGARGTIGTARIEAKEAPEDGDAVIVTRDGAVVGKAGPGIAPRAALFLGMTEMSFEQRVAAMIHVEANQP